MTYYHLNCPTNKQCFGHDSEEFFGTYEQIINKLIDFNYERERGADLEPDYGEFVYWNDPTAFDDDEVPDRPEYTREVAVSMAASVCDASEKHITVTELSPSFVTIDTEGIMTLFDPEVAEGGSLQFLQSQVGGYVDVVRAGNGVDFWLNDEGMYTEKVNLPATRVIAQYIGGRTQTFFGTCVAARVDDKGETIPLKPEDIVMIDSYRRAF